jgi:hypothetical protein
VSVGHHVVEAVQEEHGIAVRVEPGCSLRQGDGGFLDVRRQAGGVEVALARSVAASRCRQPTQR